MKKILFTSLAIALTASCTYGADFTWDGGDAADAGVDNRMSRGNNWNPNGNPVAGNTYTIQSGVNSAILTGSPFGTTAAFILNDAGSSITSSNANGTATLTNLTVAAGSSLTVNAGSLFWGNLATDGSALSFGTVSLNGGTASVLNLSTFNFGVINLGGSAVTSSNFVGSNSGNGAFNITGGSLTATTMTLATANRANLSGGTVSLSAVASWDGFLNFTTDSTASLTIVGYNLSSFETEYTQGDLLFNGLNTGTFADIFQVSGNTLSLISAVPEPSAYALLAGLFGISFVALRRRSR